jgi:hypothetical protein
VACALDGAAGRLCCRWPENARFGYCVGQRSATRGRQTEHAGFPEAGGEPSGGVKRQAGSPWPKTREMIGRTFAIERQKPVKTGCLTSATTYLCTWQKQNVLYVAPT